MSQKTVNDYVLNLLNNYNFMKREQESLQFERLRLEQMQVEETIEAMTFSSSQEERVDSGKVSDKTPTIALNYAQQHRQTKEQLLAEVDARLRWLGSTLQRLDFYIDQLEAHQASVLRNYYFDGYSWRELQDLLGVTAKTLIRHRNAAFRNLIAQYSGLEQMGLVNFTQEMENLKCGLKAYRSTQSR